MGYHQHCVSVFYISTFRPFNYVYHFVDVDNMCVVFSIGMTLMDILEEARKNHVIPMTFWEIDPVSAQGTAVSLKAYVGKICLFVWGFSSHLRIFHSYWDDSIACEGVQILTYARHSWPLSSEGSLACHTYFVTGHPFIMFTSEDPWQSHLLLSVW